MNLLKIELLIFSVKNNTEILYNALILKESLEHLDLSALPDDIRFLRTDVIIAEAVQKVEMGLRPIYPRPTLLDSKSNPLE